MISARKCEQSADKIDRERGKMARKQAEIVAEQEQVLTASEKGIDKLNSDLKALRIRLKDYANMNPKKRDEKYYHLKEQYIQRLQERATLERAHSMAEESISAANLQRIPGEA